MQLLRAIYFWLMLIILTIVFFVVLLLQQFVDRLRGQKTPFQRVHRLTSLWGWCTIKLMPGWQVRLSGTEHALQGKQAMMMVCNHESMSDIWALFYTGLPFCWLSKSSLFRIPMIGRGMKWAGYVPITRGAPESHRTAMAMSRDRLENGTSMIFFPEGTRSATGEIKPFKLGAFKLARDTGTPVLPIALRGAKAMMPKGSLIPGRTEVKITILPPVAPPLPETNLDDYAKMIRMRIVEAYSALA